MKEISIVIPILNESENIKLLVPEISKNIQKLKIKKYEIILIDDNSKDQIETIVKNLKKEIKSLKLFIRKKRIKIYPNHAFLVLKNQNIKTY